MKKNYVSPMMVGERFVAEEYVAACGDSGKTYKFKCNAGDFRSSYYVYLNGSDGVAGTNDDIAWSKNRHTTFTPCNTVHEASVDSEFINGYMRKINFRNMEDDEMIPVIVWTDGGTNTHCTSDLKISDWELAKS